MFKIKTTFFATFIYTLATSSLFASSSFEDIIHLLEKPDADIPLAQHLYASIGGEQDVIDYMPTYQNYIQLTQTHKPLSSTITPTTSISYSPKVRTLIESTARIFSSVKEISLNDLKTLVDNGEKLVSLLEKKGSDPVRALITQNALITPRVNLFWGYVSYNKQIPAEAREERLPNHQGIVHLYPTISHTFPIFCPQSAMPAKKIYDESTIYIILQLAPKTSTAPTITKPAPKNAKKKAVVVEQPVVVQQSTSSSTELDDSWMDNDPTTATSSKSKTDTKKKSNRNRPRTSGKKESTPVTATATSSEATIEKEPSLQEQIEASSKNAIEMSAFGEDITDALNEVCRLAGALSIEERGEMFKRMKEQERRILSSYAGNTPIVLDRTFERKFINKTIPKGVTHTDRNWYPVNQYSYFVNLYKFNPKEEIPLDEYGYYLPHLGEFISVE